MRNKIIALDADEVNAIILQGPTSIKIESNAGGAPEATGEALEDKGSPPVEKASAGTTVSVGKVQRGSKLKGD